MGDMADDLEHWEIMQQIKAEDYSLGRHFFTSTRPSAPKKIYWVTRGTNGCNGDKIEVKDMTTSHIINALKKCKRDNWRIGAIPYLEAELKNRSKR